MYLDLEQIESNLRLGKAVEQRLGHEINDSYTIIKWLKIEKETAEEFSVCYVESFDEGDEAFCDIYEFQVLDPDYPWGIIKNFSTIEQALSFSSKNYHASINKYVGNNMVQEEYLKYLKLKLDN